MRDPKYVGSFKGDAPEGRTREDGDTAVVKHPTKAVWEVWVWALEVRRGGGWAYVGETPDHDLAVSEAKGMVDFGPRTNPQRRGVRRRNPYQPKFLGVFRAPKQPDRGGPGDTFISISLDHPGEGRLYYVMKVFRDGDALIAKSIDFSLNLQDAVLWAREQLKPQSERVRYLYQVYDRDNIAPQKDSDELDAEYGIIPLPVPPSRPKKATRKTAKKATRKPAKSRRRNPHTFEQRAGR